MKEWRDHPDTILCHALFSSGFQGRVDVNVLDMFYSQVAEQIEQKRNRGKNSTDFLGVIEALKGRSHIKILRIGTPGEYLHKIGEGERLSQLVWVFPHAIAMLHDHPNYLITYGTLTILHPYILELLAVIVASEAVPIAFCITPTETKRSYDSFYAAVIERLDLNGMNTEFLTGVPLISDRGKGLVGLVHDRELKWILCHRHLIETIGVSSLVGSWVTRLLRCCCENDFQRERDVIAGEIMDRYGHGAYPTDEKFHQLNTMLSGCKDYDHAVLSRCISGRGGVGPVASQPQMLENRFTRSIPESRDQGHE
jgi:hypothetical protein